MSKPYSDGRWWDNPESIELLCGRCKNNLGDGKCRAFPDGIPREVLVEQVRHTKPYPGDNGILFEPKEDGDAND